MSNLLRSRAAASSHHVPRSKRLQLASQAILQVLGIRGNMVVGAFNAENEPSLVGES